MLWLALVVELRARWSAGGELSQATTCDGECACATYPGEGNPYCCKASNLVDFKSGLDKVLYGKPLFFLFFPNHCFFWHIWPLKAFFFRKFAFWVLNIWGVGWVGHFFTSSLMPNWIISQYKILGGNCGRRIFHYIALIASVCTLGDFSCLFYVVKQERKTFCAFCCQAAARCVLGDLLDNLSKTPQLGNNLAVVFTQNNKLCWFLLILNCWWTLILESLLSGGFRQSHCIAPWLLLLLICRMSSGEHVGEERVRPNPLGIIPMRFLWTWQLTGHI